MLPPKLPTNLSLNFGPFPVTRSQIFHLSPMKLSFGLVNLKPLLPGHVLICPVRVLPQFSQLSHSEVSDLFLTVQRVQRTLRRVYQADGFNVAIQDGSVAGQSVPHVHVHVIPRRARDMDDRGGGDRIYDLMDGDEAGNIGKSMQEFWRMQAERERRLRGGNGEREFASGPDADMKRLARSEDDMSTEAEMLRKEMQKDWCEDDNEVQERSKIEEG